MFSVLLIAISVSLLGAELFLGSHALWSSVHDGNFDRVVSHRLRNPTFTGVSLLALCVLSMGLVRFWRDAGFSARELRNLSALRQALKEILTLKYLGGDEMGCATSTANLSLLRALVSSLTVLWIPVLLPGDMRRSTLLLRVSAASAL